MTISVRTRRLCMVLRRLREESGLTEGDVAGRLGVSRSTVSRAETGKRGLSAEDLASTLTLYGASRSLRKALLKLHADAAKPGLLDRGELHLHEDLEKWIGFEQDADHIYNYEPLLIPGLFQTFPMPARSSRAPISVCRKGMSMTAWSPGSPDKHCCASRTRHGSRWFCTKRRYINGSAARRSCAISSGT